MTISMYQASIPVFSKQLEALAKIIQKAAAHAETKKIDPAALLTARLYPDMFAFTRQIQAACDSAKGAACRLSGTEIPSFPDTETSFAELVARIEKTVAFLKTFTPEQIDGSDDKEIIMTFGTQKFPFTGQSFLLGFALPNFFFHAATAHDILRHNGVEIGKRDFLA